MAVSYTHLDVYKRQENEQNVIEELESPEKVAMKIKADREDTYQYYQEDTYGEEKDNKIYQDNGTYDYESQEKKPWTNKWLKLAMIIAIVVIGFPIVIPLGAGILALIAGIVIAVFCLFAAIVIGFAAVVMVGVVPVSYTHLGKRRITKVQEKLLRKHWKMMPKRREPSII